MQRKANKKPSYQLGFIGGDGAESLTSCKHTKAIGGSREYYLTGHTR